MLINISKAFFWIALLSKHLSNALITSDDNIIAKDNDNVVRVTEKNYPILSKGVDEYYSILFITMTSRKGDNFDCPACIDFEPIYRKISKAVAEQAPTSKVLFYIADVHENPTMVKDLHLKNVPHIVVYGAAEKGKDFSWPVSPFYHYEFNSNSIKDHLHFGDFIAKLLHIYIKIDEDFDTTEFLSYFIGFMVFFIFFKKVILPRMTNKLKTALMIFGFGMLLPSISGYKFTQIHNIPLIARNDQGKIIYFHGGNGWQVGIEVFNVSLMYITLGGLVVILIRLGNSTKIDIQRKSVLSTMLGVILFYGFAYYIGCYKIKQSDYPFQINGFR